MNSPGPDYLSALSTGAAITSLLGLSGFIVACILLIYIVRTRAERNEIEKLKLLPREERPALASDMLSRYRVTLDKNPDVDKYNLVLREMNLRFRKQVGLAILGALVFLICFAILAFRTPSEAMNGGKRQVTEADKRVLELKVQVEALRGDFEARFDNPGSLGKVQREGKRLAKMLALIKDNQLNPSRRIIKDEYGGWALLLVARTFTDPRLEHRTERIRYAKEALERFDSAIRKMKDVERAYSEGDAHAAEDYAWIMAEPDGPWNLTNYLKAMAFGVIAEAGGDVTKEQIQAQLSEVSDQFKAAYPPQHVPELSWVLE